MKYSEKTYLAALAALAALRSSMSDAKEQATVDFVADAIAEKADRDNNAGWISVEDRLPEDGLNILVANVETGTQYVSHKDSIFFDENKSAFVPTSYLKEFHFTHWMPLPEPPEGDET